MFSPREPKIRACHDTRLVAGKFAKLHPLDRHRVLVGVDRCARWWWPLAQYRQVQVKTSVGIMIATVAYVGIRDPVLKCRQLTYYELAGPHPSLEPSSLSRHYDDILKHVIAGIVVALLAGCASYAVRVAAHAWNLGISG